MPVHARRSVVRMISLFWARVFWLASLDTAHFKHCLGSQTLLLVDRLFDQRLTIGRIGRFAVKRRLEYGLLFDRLHIELNWRLRFAMPARIRNAAATSKRRSSEKFISDPASGHKFGRSAVRRVQVDGNKYKLLWK